MPKTLDESFKDVLAEAPAGYRLDTRPDLVDLWRKMFFIGADGTLKAVLRDDAIDEGLVHVAILEAVQGPAVTSAEGGPLATAFGRFVKEFYPPGTPRLLADDLMFYAGGHALLRYVYGAEGVSLELTHEVIAEIEAWRVGLLPKTRVN